MNEVSHENIDKLTYAKDVIAVQTEMKEKRSHNNKLQRERLSRGWKQEEVAEKLGVDVRTVRRWEGGHPVRPLNIAGLMRLFGKSADELGLIEETDEPS